MADLDQLIQQAQILVGRFQAINIQGPGWSGNAREGFIFNPTAAESESGEGTGSGGTPPSPPATGACCVDGDCTQQTLADCETLGGDWFEGVPCDPNPCTVTPCCMFTDGGGGLGHRDCGARYWNQAACGFFNGGDGRFYRVFDSITGYSDDLGDEPCAVCFTSVTVRDSSTGGIYTFHCDGSCECDICTGPGAQIFIDHGEYSF